MNLKRKCRNFLRLLVLPAAFVVLPVTGQTAPLAVGVCDDFESGQANWTISPGTGYGGISSATSSSPSNSMFLNGGTVTATSIAVDTSSALFTNLTMWIRRGHDSFSEDPDPFENLVVEYLDNVGTWMELGTFGGNGQPGGIYVRSYLLSAAGRHAGMRLRFRMVDFGGVDEDFWHVDDVCFDQVPAPSLLVSKIAQTVNDPVNGGTNPKAIPGAVLRYTVGVTNQGDGSPAVGSIVITDPLPAEAALFVDTAGGDPIVFVDGAVPSGLGYSYAADVTFSNQPGGGAPYTYIPVPDVQGYDPLVTGYRIQPTGTMNPAVGSSFPSFNIRFLVRLE
jgi:uncharacterized repeat protein (TIGR01451 family)